MPISDFATGEAKEIEPAFANLTQVHADALIVEGDQFFLSRIDRIAGLAQQYSVPAAYTGTILARSGGLISYGADDQAVSRQAGIYVGRILKGEKPSNLPVQQPTKFELAINLKTAKALGITVPQPLLQRADGMVTKVRMRAS